MTPWHDLATAAVLITSKIRELNDRFRESLAGGQVVMTAGVAALSPPVVAAIMEGVKTFAAFDADNDP